MHYREASALDIPAMARIRSLDWGTEEYWNTRITKYMQRALHPQHALEPRVLYVANENEEIVGLIAGHLTRRFDCQGELEWISVLPAFRRKGAASGLLQLLAKWFVGKKSLRICVDVEPDNVSAREFYKKHGAENLNEQWLVWKNIGVVIS